MNIVFDKCSDALDYAIKNKSFAVFHSKDNIPNSNIHTHECCEVFLCLKGGSSFLIDDCVYDVKDGDIFYMNQFEPHKVTFRAKKAVERYVLQIHPEFMLNFSTDKTTLSKCLYSKKRIHRITPSKEDLKQFKTYFAELEKHYEFADDVIKQSIIMRLLSHLNILSMHSGEDEKYALPDKTLQLAIEYINAHFCEDITLDDIAKSSFISVTKLCRLFKDNLGTTAGKYITGKRISEAKKCLKNGMSVSDTALECGFGDYSNFIRIFSSHVGISPGKYLKSMK